MKFMYYILGKNLEIIGTDDVREWGKRFEKADRHLALTKVGAFDISTVFLGLDHNFGDGPPILWETMIFDHEKNNPAFDEYQERYSSFEEARAGHERAVAMIQQKLYAD